MQEQLSSLWITPTACAESCYVEADQRKLTTRLGTWFCIGEEKGENIRRERGQWFGPARVVLVENKRVVWLVHAHRLVRASPQQLRAASMWEWKSIRDTEEFKMLTREWIRKIGHQDFFDLDPEDLPEPSENEYTPSLPPGEFEVREDDPMPEPEEEAAAGKLILILPLVM